MKRLLLIVLFFVCSAPLTLSAQGMRAGAAREANFLYEVKVIDEFFERFNDDPTSFLRQEYLRLNKPINFTRRQLVEYLFEQPVKPTDNLIRKFVDQVTDSAQPQKISFNDSGWYAEVSCAFTYNGKGVEIPLVMQIAQDTDKSTRWLIAGIGDAPIFQDGAAATASNKVKDGKKFISPSDYATNFLKLYDIIKPGFEGVNYMTPELQATERGKKFEQLVQGGKLRFEAPGYMRFYFFQVPNFTFVVDRYVRQTTHSGWLISSLTATTEEEKQARKEKLLQRQL